MSIPHTIAKTYQVKPRWTKIRWDNESMRLVAKTVDVWTAKRWVKAGLPVVTDERERSWAVELTPASPRLRWLLVMRTALRPGRFPKRELHRRNQRRAVSRPIEGPSVAGETRKFEVRGNGLAEVFDALDAIPAPNSGIGDLAAKTGGPEDFDPRLEEE